MTLPVIVRPQAAADVREVFEELETARHGLGRKFLGRLREGFERLEMFPLMYGEIRENVRADSSPAAKGKRSRMVTPPRRQAERAAFSPSTTWVAVNN